MISTKILARATAAENDRKERAIEATLAIANAIRCHADAIDRLARAIIDSGDMTAEAIRRASVDQNGRTIPNALVAIRDVLEHVNR